MTIENEVKEEVKEPIAEVEAVKEPKLSDREMINELYFNLGIKQAHLDASKVQQQRIVSEINAIRAEIDKLNGKE